MGISVISVCAILAIIPLYWLPVLPGLHGVWVLIAAGVALGVQKKNALKLTGQDYSFFAGAFSPRKKASGLWRI